MTEEKGLEADVADKIGEYVKHKGTLRLGSRGASPLTCSIGGSDLLDQLLADETLMTNANASQGLSEMEILFKLLRAYNVVDRVRVPGQS